MTRLNLTSEKNRFAIVTITLASVFLLVSGLRVIGARDNGLRPASNITLYTDEVLEVADWVRIETSEEIYTLTRTFSGWRLTEKAGFPVADNVMTDFQESLSALTIDRPSTALAARHSAIGATDPANNGFGAAIQIDGMDEVYIFGRKDSHQYVRLRGEDQTWRLSSLLPPLYNPLRWISLGEETLPRLTHDVVGIDVRGAGGTYAIYPSNGQWVTDQGDVISDATIDAAIYTSRILEYEDVRRATLALPYATLYLHYGPDRSQTIQLVRDENEVWARFEFEGVDEDVSLYTGREFLIDELTALDLIPEL